MTRNQIWITVGAIAAALVLGIAVTLVATGGDDTDEISTSGTRPTTPTTEPIRPATTPPPTVPPTVPPTTGPAPTLPPTVPPTVVVIPPETAPPSPPTTPITSPGTTVPTTPPTVPPTVPPTTVVPVTDPGITDTEVRLAVIADDETVVQGFRAWAKSANKKALGGRKVVVDAFVVNGDPGQFAAAVDTACEQSFAIVGSFSTGDSALGDLTTCGIPDLPARALSSEHRAAPNTFAVVPTASTQQQVGGFRWLLDNVDGCCEQYVISSTDPAAAAATQASVEAANTVGFTAAGGATLADDAPQSSYTPLVEEMAQAGATFGRSDLGFASTIALRTEAAEQDLTGVKAWFCLAQCYQPGFLDQGGSAVAGQLVQISTNPFEDASSIPAMKRYLDNGGPRTQAALESAAAGLLFQNAAAQVVESAGKDGLTRAALLEAVAGVSGFTAGGVLGPTDVGARAPNGCFALMRVTDGKFVRAHPTTAGELSCGPDNLLVVGP